MEQTWQNLLAWFIQDTQEKRRVAAALEVDPSTLSRWINGKMKPRIYHLKQLPALFPRYQKQFEQLISAEYPNLFPGELPRPSESTHIPEETVSDISAILYDQIIAERARGLTPTTQANLYHFILRSCANQLDGNRQGVAVLFAQCLAPKPPDPQVRALRVVSVEQSAMWRHPLPHTFMGASSLAGTVVKSGQPLICADTSRESWLGLPVPEDIKTIIAYPVQSAGLIAGCLMALSRSPEYFTELRCSLLMRFANLLSLAFREDEFYPRGYINLQDVPSLAMQQTCLTIFAEKVERLLQRTDLSREEAEHHILCLFQQQEERIPDGREPQPSRSTTASQCLRD